MTLLIKPLLELHYTSRGVSLNQNAQYIVVDNLKSNIHVVTVTGRQGATKAAESPTRSEEAAGIPPYKIDETVRSLSEHLGWDITKGSEAGKLA